MFFCLLFEHTAKQNISMIPTVITQTVKQKEQRYETLTQMYNLLRPYVLSRSLNKTYLKHGTTFRQLQRA